MASSILLISDATDITVASALETPNHVVTRVADLEAAQSAEGEHQVVVIDLDDESHAIIDAVRGIREAPALTSVPVLALTRNDDIDDRIRLLEAGVDDVMIRPFDPRELDARVEALVLRYQRSKGIADASGGAPVITVRDTNQQRLIAIFSPKGGVGTTTIAVNLAVALAQRTPDKVAILDLDLQFGQVATHLNIPLRQTIADLVRDDVALRDPGVFSTFLDRHASSLMVLGAPPTPDGANSIDASLIERLLETAGRAYQTVVIDAGSSLDELCHVVLARATDIVIVVTPEFPALKAVHAMRDLLEASNAQLAETSFILNQIFSREILRSRDIEEALGTKIAMTIPYDAFVFLKGVNEGVPVVVGAPRSAASEQIFRLASRLSGIELPGEPAERRPKGLGALFGRG